MKIVQFEGTQISNLLIFVHEITQLMCDVISWAGQYHLDFKVLNLRMIVRQWTKRMTSLREVFHKILLSENTCQHFTQTITHEVQKHFSSQDFVSTCSIQQ